MKKRASETVAARGGGELPQLPDEDPMSVLRELLPAAGGSVSLHGVSVEEAKLEITKVFYGGKPSSEIPFLTQLTYRWFGTAYYFLTGL